MKNFSLTAILAAGAALLALPAGRSHALEFRTWLSIDGRMFDAELARVLGPDVELRDKEGRITKVAKSSLSFGDLDYIQENAPADNSAPRLGSAPAVKAKIPSPAREIKVDNKVFKKEAGDFKINSRTYRVCETPHFKVMYMKPVDPMEVAELAERLWIDTAFFHSTFISKWVDRKMGILLVNDDEAYDDAGSWFADMVSQTGDQGKDNAERIRKTWPESDGGVIHMPAAQADAEGIFDHVRVIRAFTVTATKDANGKITKGKPQLVKGVFDSFRTHLLAQSMLSIHAGGLGSASQDGNFAMFTGFAYYKEIQITGKSVTNLIGTQGSGKDLSRSAGFQSDKNWATETKKMIKAAERAKEGEKEREWKPNLPALFATTGQSPSQAEIVFSYAFSRFLQSTPERLTAFNKLCQQIDVSNQVPELGDIGKMYGYADGPALEKAWIAWMDSGDFK